MQKKKTTVNNVSYRRTGIWSQLLNRIAGSPRMAA